MKKHFFAMSSIFLSALLFFCVFQVTNAYIPYVPYIPMSNPFGGKIIHTKATEIQTLESTGFVCNVPGETITISPVGKYPTSYLIPYGTTSKTKKPLGKNRWILGVYKGVKTAIICTNEETGVTTQVNLNPITLYGTS